MILNLQNYIIETVELAAPENIDMKCRKVGLIPDITSQKLHFNINPKWFMCSLNVKTYYPKEFHGIQIFHNSSEAIRQISSCIIN